MPRVIAPPAQSLSPEAPPFEAFNLPEGATLVEQRQPDWFASAQAVGSRAVIHEYGQDSPIEGTFSIVGPNDFELTLIDGLHGAIRQRGFGRTRKDFEALERALDSDPFGDTNIDEFKDTDAGQWARIVHAVTGPLADLVPGKQLALKGTGLDMQSTREKLERRSPHRLLLADQFRPALEAQRRQAERAPQGVGGRIFVNEVYGVLRYRDDRGALKEWMLMERAPGQAVSNATVALSRGGTAPGFKPEAYPELYEIADERDRWPAPGRYTPSVCQFKELADRINRDLGYQDYDSPFSDLNGNNLLEHQTPDGPIYTIIDVKSHAS